MFVFSILVITILLYYLYFRRSRKALYEFYQSVPHAGELPLLGHTHWFIGGPERLLKNIERIGELISESGGLGTIWIGPHLYVVPLNPEDAQRILENCMQKDLTYKFLQNWLGDGLFVAEVELWKQHRRLLLPIFHNRLVEDFITVFGEQSGVLLTRLEGLCGQPEFDVYPYVSSCMLDIVFETALGERMDVQHNSETPYLRARNTVMSIINLRLFKAWLQPDLLFNLTPYAKLQKESIEATHQFTDEVITKKRNEFNRNGNRTEGRKDMVELLMERDGNFTDKQLREHIDSITIAGNDTTSLVVAYTLVLLGHHPEVQEKVYQELQEILGDDRRMPTKEDLNKMNYMERVLKESMRLYAVVPVIGRSTQKELKLSTCTVPAGVSCAVSPYLIHRSKAVWGPDVDAFNPDRFLPENSKNRHPCAFIPFSHGARNCIGRHFGMLAMKMVMAKILQKFKVKSSASTLDRLKIEIILFPVKGHLLSLEKRL